MLFGDIQPRQTFANDSDSVKPEDSRLADNCTNGCHQISADDWTDMGIALQTGDSLNIEAMNIDTSMILREENGQWLTAWGVDAPAPTGFTMPNANIGALLGRIGPDGEMFEVRTSYYNESVTASGNLFLVVNDDDRTDNEGCFDVQISVNLPPVDDDVDDDLIFGDIQPRQMFANDSDSVKPEDFRSADNRTNGCPQNAPPMFPMDFSRPYRTNKSLQPANPPIKRLSIKSSFA
ncbi:MAG: hypothetical protein GY869_13370 [Planctomycetes bacterium]|nr:hypothetical protein [Planctomycetota bacterium]